MGKYIETEGVDKGRIIDPDMAQSAAINLSHTHRLHDEAAINSEIKVAIAEKETTGYIKKLRLALITKDDNDAIRYLMDARELKKRLDAAYDKIQNS